MKHVKGIRLVNYKRFNTFTVDFDERINLIIGDNECGKSSILTALDIVLSGSRNKVETLGLDKLFNENVIANFLGSDKRYENLPRMVIEVYLNEQNNEALNGTNNGKGIETDGLKLICEPNDELSSHIRDVLAQPEPHFPFEYYSINFKTFRDNPYNGYTKYLSHILIDNSLTSSEYAMKEYVKDMYFANVGGVAERYGHLHKYRVHKESFKNDVLHELNNRLGSFHFAIKTSTKANLETDLTILEDNIVIENKGKGKQCFIKTALALNRGNEKLEIVLFEEPENHLSHLYMKKLIRMISETDKQIFITTHSDLISTRLDLRKTVLLNSNCTTPLLLNTLPESTAKFFMKAPDNNILEFVLSKKVVLVEGDAEYILIEAMYQKLMNRKLEDDGIHVISVDGTSFKRYLDIASILNIRTAVIRDNDGDYRGNCVDNYSNYNLPHIGIFADKSDDRCTFEVCLYLDNKAICEELFAAGRRTLNVQDFMLKNKADVAFSILEQKSNDIIVPDYIVQALAWIRQ